MRGIRGGGRPRLTAHGALHVAPPSFARRFSTLAGLGDTFKLPDGVELGHPPLSGVVRAALTGKRSKSRIRSRFLGVASRRIRQSDRLRLGTGANRPAPCQIDTPESAILCRSAEGDIDRISLANIEPLEPRRCSPTAAKPSHGRGGDSTEHGKLDSTPRCQSACHESGRAVREGVAWPIPPVLPTQGGNRAQTTGPEGVPTA
jgi:hypothetical protein